MIRNLRCTVTIDFVLANSKTQNAFLFTVNAIFRHDYPLAVEPGSTPSPLVQKKSWRYSLSIDMLLSAVSFLVVAQSSSEIPEGLMNNPVLFCFHRNIDASVLKKARGRTRAPARVCVMSCGNIRGYALLSHANATSIFFYLFSPPPFENLNP